MNKDICCRICGLYFNNLALHLYHKHNKTRMIDYRAEYNYDGPSKLVSPETCAKQSSVRKGIVVSDLTLKTLRESSKNRIRKPCSAETKAKLSIANKGKKLSAESIQKMKETISNNMTLIRRQQLRDAIIGKTYEERLGSEKAAITKAKQSKSRKEYLSKLSSNEKKIIAEHSRIAAYNRIKKWNDNGYVPKNWVSEPENRFAELLSANNIVYTRQFRVSANRTYRIYDFYIPHKNLLIEIDGIYWHARNKQIIDMNAAQLKNYYNDIEKNKLASQHNFKLIRIWEDELNCFDVASLI